MINIHPAQPPFLSTSLSLFEFIESKNIIKIEALLSTQALSIDLYQEAMMRAIQSESYEEIVPSFTTSGHFFNISSDLICEAFFEEHHANRLNYLLRNLHFNQALKENLLMKLIQANKLEYLFILMDKEPKDLSEGFTEAMCSEIVSVLKTKGYEDSEELNLFAEKLGKGFSFIEILGQENGLKIFSIDFEKGRSEALLDSFAEIKQAESFDVGFKNALGKDLSLLENISSKLRTLASIRELALSQACTLHDVFYVNMITSF